MSCLAIDIDNTGTASLQLANLHGDIIATTTLGQAGITNYTHTDEYGQPDTTTTGRYGWMNRPGVSGDSLVCLPQLAAEGCC